jgi:hypothetical protein
MKRAILLFTLACASASPGEESRGTTPAMNDQRPAATHAADPQQLPQVAVNAAPEKTLEEAGIKGSESIANILQAPPAPKDLGEWSHASIPARVEQRNHEQGHDSDCALDMGD